MDLKSGERTLLTPPEGKEKIFNGSFAYFSRDGKGIYFVTDRANEFSRLAYLDFAGKRHRFPAKNVKWDISEIAMSPDRKLLAFVSNEDGIGRLHLMDTTNSKELPVPEMPAGVVSKLIWHRNLPYLGFVFASTRSPSDVYSLNIDTGKIEKWTTARHAAKVEEFREPELIRWKSFDGRMISGFLYRPPESFTGKRPVIINIHGGPTEQFRPTYLHEANYYVHALGIAIVYPNVRGSTGYGKTFMKLDNGLLRDGVTKDIGSLLDWIAKDGRLDSDRVLLQGGSYGGYVALSAAEAYPNRICALISYIAPTNLATFVERNSENDPEGWRHEMGDERDRGTREFLEKIAPVNGADRIVVPTFLAIGRKDLMTSVPETERIAGTLKEKGVPVWHMVAQDEAHNFKDPWVYQYKFCAEALFVKKYLLGKDK
jgi:dipeptidyl aminopeptidase/acylaminoacyl peptidase